MLESEIDNLIRVLQASVAPCLLISGFGFFLLTMSNRLGRATDRVRTLHADLKESSKDEGEKIARQIAVIFKRCRILQAAIVSLTFSIFLVIINVLLLFSAIVFQLDLKMVIEVCFATSILSLILSLILFLTDISITLKSLKIEIGEDSRIKI